MPPGTTIYDAIRRLGTSFEEKPLSVCFLCLQCMKLSILLSCVSFGQQGGDTSPSYVVLDSGRHSYAHSQHVCKDATMCTSSCPYVSAPHCHCCHMASIARASSFPSPGPLHTRSTSAATPLSRQLCVHYFAQAVRLICVNLHGNAHVQGCCVAVC